MCGIVGYTGREQAAPILLDGLEHLEYRGPMEMASSFPLNEKSTLGNLSSSTVMNGYMGCP